MGLFWQKTRAFKKNKKLVLSFHLEACLEGRACIQGDPSVQEIWRLAFALSLGRAIHGPIPVWGETLLSGPLVHTEASLKTRHQGIGPY